MTKVGTAGYTRKYSMKYGKPGQLTLGGKGRGRFVQDGICHLQFIQQHTGVVGTRTVEDTRKNEGSDDLRHVNEEEDTEDYLGSIPHCINAQDHHHCD